MQQTTTNPDTWFNAYSHLPSRTLTKMLLMDDGKRPDRLSAINYILSKPRYQRRRIRRDTYIEVPL